MYDCLKTIHILGVTLLLGNVTVSAVWKVFADRTGDPGIMSFAQRLITLTDWSLTLGGIALTIGGGYGMAAVSNLHPLTTPWLVTGELLFATSGVMWLALLVPSQIRLQRLANASPAEGVLSAGYRAESRRWLVWGIVATIPLVAALYVMIAKGI